MTKDELTALAYERFAEFPKPVHSTNYEHCEECREYDDLLRGIKREDLSIEDIGNLCWGPVPFLLPQAMAYYLPRFIELAISNVTTNDYQPYITQFINQIGFEPGREAFFLLDQSHKAVVYQAFKYINDHYRGLVEYYCWDDDLDAALLNWRNASTENRANLN